MQITLPAETGICLKPQHYHSILETRPAVGWFEIHPENYMGSGGPPHRYLSRIRQDYAVSMHGVGLSLGSATGLDDAHLDALCKLVNRYQPAQVSEHLSWSRIGNTYLNDLLPLPYNRESLEVLVDNIDRAQNTLGRTILVENPSAYLGFDNNTFSEPEFLNELVKRTGCGLLLDINNVYVSACNQAFDPHDYLSQLSMESVGEIHLAGHSVEQINGSAIRIDDHGSRVVDQVWSLFSSAIESLGKVMPVLIEWDTDVPELEVLLSEMDKAASIMKGDRSSPGSPVAV